jgi:hypothetical protein
MRSGLSHDGARRRPVAWPRTLAALWFAVALVPLTRGVASADVAPPLDLVLVLDTSASMVQNDPRRTVLAEAASLVERLGPDDGAGLVLFGGSATARVELAPLSRGDQRAALLRAIAGVRYEDRLSDLGAGVERGLYELRDHGRPDTRLAMVFFTDGIVDTGSPASDVERTAWLKTELLGDARTRGVRIFAVAFSEQADYLLLRQMAAATGGEYYRAIDGDQVARVFATIASELDKPTPTAAAAPPVDADAPSADRPSDVRTTVWPAFVLVGALGLGGLVILAIGYRRRRAAPHTVGDAVDPAQQLAPASLLEFKTGERIPITDATFTVGRSDGNDVVLKSDLVSSEHATIEFRDRQYVVVDLRSTNGTFVNGRRIDGPTVLKDGDLVDFDEFRYQFVGGTSGVTGTIVRTSAVERTNVRLEPIHRQPETPDAGAVRPHHEMIETHAGTHQLVHCAVHTDQQAVAHCVRCGKAGCAECVSITEEGPICTECAAPGFPRTLS